MPASQSLAISMAYELANVAVGLEGGELWLVGQQTGQQRAFAGDQT